MKANVNTYIADNGDICLDCDTCGEHEIVPIIRAQSTFWEVYVGTALLVMLGHIEREHNDGQYIKQGI